jgi:hypothetical protein
MFSLDLVVTIGEVAECPIQPICILWKRDKYVYRGVPLDLTVNGLH